MAVQFTALSPFDWMVPPRAIYRRRRIRAALTSPKVIIAVKALSRALKTITIAYTKIVANVLKRSYESPWAQGPPA